MSEDGDAAYSQSSDQQQGDDSLSSADDDIDDWDDELGDIDDLSDPESDLEDSRALLPATLQQPLHTGRQ